MRRPLGIGLAAAALAAPLALVASGTFASSSSAAQGNDARPANQTVSTAGPQHWCGTNGIQCTEPALDWDEYAGYDKAKAHGAHINGYIGHDEPATLFYSNTPGSGNDVTYKMRLPSDPPTRPRQGMVGGGVPREPRYGLRRQTRPPVSSADSAPQPGHLASSLGLAQDRPQLSGYSARH